MSKTRVLLMTVAQRLNEACLEASKEYFGRWFVKIF
jgi:hypothetical protein